MPTINGTSGDDVLVGGGGNDTIDGKAGNDTITGGAGVDHIFGGSGNDTFLFATATDYAVGDSFDGELDFDTLQINVGTANFLLSALTYTGLESLVTQGSTFALGVTVAELGAFTTAQGWFRLLGSGNLTLSGVALGASTLVLSNTITGFTYTAAAGVAIRIEGTNGATVTGSASNDTFVDLNGSADTYDGAGGIDTVDYSAHTSNASVYLSYYGPDQGQGLYGDVLISIENVITGSGNDRVRDSAANNRIETGAGNDRIETFGGNDTLLGGIGDDTYYGVIDDDTIIEFTGEGTDLVRIATELSAFTIPANVENLSYEAGNAADLIGNGLNNEITGGSGNDRIYGMGGNDYLDGLSGSDELYGGAGDDIYRIRLGYDESGLIVELANEGIDTVVTNLPSYALPDNVENLTGGAYAIGPTIYGNTLIGNALANTITGSESHDTIYGLDGDDTIDGNLGNDTIYGGNGNDLISGYTGTNLLYGEGGDDVLVVVASPAQGVIDGGEGIDTFRMNVGVSATLVISSIERVEFISGIINLTLNSQQVAGLAANTHFIGTTGIGRIVINMSAAGALSTSAYTFGEGITLFRINGSTGDDSIVGPANIASELNGGSGNDTITGGTFGDTLTGDSGIDNLSGGAGNDLILLNTNGSGSSVDGGADFDTLRLNSGANVSLGSLTGIEAVHLTAGANLTLTASQAMTGLAFNSAFSGNGTVMINMGGGVPLGVSGFQGAATNPGVTFTIYGSADSDFIKASHFSNSIVGGAGQDAIRGGNGIDTIDGGTERDKIAGWGGADVLTGGGGNDQFRYLFASDSGIGAAADRITDFTIGTDVIDFRLLDSDVVTADIQMYAFSFIGTAAFAVGGGAQVRHTDSGADLLVQMDLDGNGAADMEIVLQGLAGQTMTAGDFLFV